MTMLFVNGHRGGRLCLLGRRRRPSRLHPLLRVELGPVRDAGLAAPDPDVWAFAAANGFAIVSKYTDFQQRALLYGHPPKVVWVRSGNYSTAVVVDLLRSRLADIQAFEADSVASFLALA